LGVASEEDTRSVAVLDPEDVAVESSEGEGMAVAEEEEEGQPADGGAQAVGSSAVAAAV
jgi:hypothetical protein